MSNTLAALREGAAATQDARATDPNAALLEQMVAQAVHRAAPAVQPMELRSFDELERWADRAARSTMVPPAYKGKPDDIILAVQMGSELGLRPMQALQNIATINGRPSIWGDAMLALCMGHPLYRNIKETVEGEGDDRVAVCIAVRQGDAPKEGRFSVADAKKAGLWGKSGPWSQYPDRMLKMRARGFALRDTFPDKLRGLVVTEEADDYVMAEAFSAAPPAPPPVASDAPKRRTPGDVIADFDAVVTAEDYYKILDGDGERIAWLKANKPETFEKVDAARAAAAARMEQAPNADKPGDDGWPGPDAKDAE